MRIHVYTIQRNDEKLIPYFLRHYTQFADRIFVFDDESTDSSLSLLRACPKVTVEKTAVRGIDDRYFRSLYSGEYRKRRRECDWVVCVDIDEFVYHPRIMERLEEYGRRGVEVVKCGGWSMVGQAFPSGNGQIYDEVKTGMYDIWQGKPAIFSSKINIKYGLGRHAIKNTDLVVDRSEEIKLLHFRYLGDEYCRMRNSRNLMHLSPDNIKFKWGRHNDPQSTYYHSQLWYEHILHTTKGVVVELPFLP